MMRHPTQPHKIATVAKTWVTGEKSTTEKPTEDYLRAPMKDPITNFVLMSFSLNDERRPKQLIFDGTNNCY